MKSEIRLLIASGGVWASSFSHLDYGNYGFRFHLCFLFLCSLLNFIASFTHLHKQQQKNTWNNKHSRQEGAEKGQFVFKLEHHMPI